MENKSTLIKNWHNAGIDEGDVVLLHSSLRRTLLSAKSAGQPFSAEIVLESFLDAIGPQGTLLLPLFNFDFASGKAFDLRSTPSHMGILTELARKYTGAIRTRHPIYSFAAIGHQADQFAGIDNKSGYGDDSPFGLLRRLGGKVAVLDLPDQHSMTFYHHVEEMCGVDYRHFKKFTGAYTNMAGETSEKTYRLFVRDLERGVMTDVNPMGERLWEEGLYRGDRPMSGSGLRTICAQDMFDFVSDQINQGNAEGFLYSIRKD